MGQATVIFFPDTFPLPLFTFRRQETSQNKNNLLSWEVNCVFCYSSKVPSKFKQERDPFTDLRRQFWLRECSTFWLAIPLFKKVYTPFSQKSLLLFTPLFLRKSFLLFTPLFQKVCYFSHPKKLYFSRNEMCPHNNNNNNKNNTFRALICRLQRR